MAQAQLITMSVKDAQRYFFDREKVLRYVDRATAGMLWRAGAYIRSVIQNSIVEDTNSSQPGHPPKSHTGLLKNYIFFIFDEAKKSVVIGPTLLGRPKTNPNTGDTLVIPRATVPNVLEFGGPATVVSVGKSGRRTEKNIVIAPRPYMGPGFERAVAKKTDLFRIGQASAAYMGP